MEKIKSATWGLFISLTITLIYIGSYYSTKYCSALSNSLRNSYLFFILGTIAVPIIFYLISIFIKKGSNPSHLDCIYDNGDSLDPNLKIYKRSNFLSDSELRSLKTQHKWYTDILLLFGIMILVWTFPILIIYWLISPHTINRRIKVSIFFISSFLSVLYFLKNKDKFPTTADKITYFTGVVIGPVTIMDILL